MENKPQFLSTLVEKQNSSIMEELGCMFITESTDVRVLLKIIIQLSALQVLYVIIRVRFKKLNYKDTPYVILVKGCYYIFKYSSVSLPKQSES
jgi:hypothetical protein